RSDKTAPFLHRLWGYSPLRARCVHISPVRSRYGLKRRPSTLAIALALVTQRGARAAALSLITLGGGGLCRCPTRLCSQKSRRHDNATMKAPENFDLREVYGCYRLSGHGTLDE